MSKGRRNREKRAGTAAPHPRPSSSAAAVPATAIRVRRAETADELAQFEQWASMADAGGPKTARKLIDTHAEGVLGSALDSYGRDGAAARVVAAGGLDALTWARTVALVADSDAGPVGGLMAGPSGYFLSGVAPLVGEKGVLAGILRTSKLHFVSVEPSHRRSGAGTALVRAALEIVRGSDADLFYGQYEARDAALERFYDRCGFTLHPIGHGLDFSAILGLSGGPTPLPTERFFVHRFR